MKCPKCDYWTTSKRGFSIHKAKAHKIKSVPNFIGMGIMKRKLTRKEAKKVTKEVMDMGVDSDSRFTMAVLKSIELINN